MYNDGIKILAIGNSFSMDAMCYLPDLLCQLGMDESGITLINAAIGGCGLETHALNAESDKRAYLREVFRGNGEIEEPETLYSIKELIRENAWDVITLQQVSGDAGKADTYGGDLQYMIKYVKNTQ